jgi:mRNA interferase MazF
MGKYKQGDVLFLNFPFSDDLTKSKARPVLVVSNSNLQAQELICLQITSRTDRNEPQDVFLSGDDVIPNLTVKSVIRTHLVQSINSSVILKKWGEISEEKLIRVLENLQIILEKQ